MSYNWIAGEYTSSATTDESRSSPLKPSCLGLVEWNWKVIALLRWVDWMGIVQLVWCMAVVKLTYFHLHVITVQNHLKKKQKTGAIPPVGETKSRMWGLIELYLVS